jgi:hypothetical protein
MAGIEVRRRDRDLTVQGGRSAPRIASRTVVREQPMCMASSLGLYSGCSAATERRTPPSSGGELERW